MDPGVEALSNYIILNKILQNFNLKDRTKLKPVCRLWKTVIDEIETRSPCAEIYYYLAPQDLNAQSSFDSQQDFIDCLIYNKIEGPVLFIILFSRCGIAEQHSFVAGYRCSLYKQTPCRNCCNSEHPLLTVTYDRLGLAANTVAIQITQSTQTEDSSYTFMPIKILSPDLCLGFGLALPVVPGIRCHFLRHDMYDDELVPPVSDAYIAKKALKIAKKEFIKGALIFSVADLQKKFVQILQKLFSTTQFVLGGCQNLANSCQWANDELYFSFPLIVLLFTAPNSSFGEFNMYSLAISQDVADVNAMEVQTTEFAGNVPKHQNTAALIFYTKLWVSALLDNQKEVLRRWFPDTPIAGGECFSTISTDANHTIKKNVKDFSSVFVLFGW